METLTRLRLLAAPPLVQAAETLHRADYALTTFAFESDDYRNTEAWRHLRDDQKNAREALIDEARKLLGLGSGAPIAHWRGGEVELPLQWPDRGRVLYDRRLGQLHLASRE